MEEQGKEVVKEINRHQEGSQGHGRGHQQGNGMHNQVEISSHLCAISWSRAGSLSCLPIGRDPEHSWRDGPHWSKLSDASGPAAATKGSQEGTC